MEIQAKPSLKAAARSLAEENREYEDGIVKTYWFDDPDQQEIRLVHVDKNALDDDAVHPAYFRAVPKDAMPYRTAIALIRPEDEERLSPPSDWGAWQQAEVWDWKN